MASRSRRVKPADRRPGRRGSRIPARAHRLARILTPDERTRRLRRALDYPYALVQGSFWLPARPGVAPEPGPRRLLAYGANRSPEGLERKLGSPARPVAVVHGWLRDFDVVYSAHLSPYGAVPATLQHSPGTEVSVHVLHLDDSQLAKIDVAEPNYQLVRLEGVTLELDGHRGPLEAVDAYLSRHGCLVLDGDECALAAIPARGRSFAARDHEATLAAVRDRLAPGEELEAFILGGLADPALQGRRTARLRREARGLAWRGWRALED